MEARNIAAIAHSPYVNQAPRTPDSRLAAAKSAAKPDTLPFSSYEISPYKWVFACVCECLCACVCASVPVPATGGLGLVRTHVRRPPAPLNASCLRVCCVRGVSPFCCGSKPATGQCLQLESDAWLQVSSCAEFWTRAL